VFAPLGMSGLVLEVCECGQLKINYVCNPSSKVSPEEGDFQEYHGGTHKDGDIICEVGIPIRPLFVAS